MLPSEPFVKGAQHDVRYKVVLVGESMVGKTSLLRCWRGDSFQSSLMPTIGLDFATRIYTLPEGRLRLDIWDTAGQERYGTMTSVHYRDAKAFIFVYDVCDAESFRQLARRWLNAVDDHIAVAVPIFIVGNKTDLKDQRQVTVEEGKRFADSQGATAFETSAKLGDGVHDLFDCVAMNLTPVWTYLKFRCESMDESYPNFLKKHSVRCEKCNKCGQSHKKRAIRLRPFSGQSTRTRKNCCTAKESMRFSS